MPSARTPAGSSDAASRPHAVSQKGRPGSPTRSRSIAPYAAGATARIRS
ncbi:hypothetical protein M2302_001066 [Micromonospora sp. A200]|nr:hypothetical protein [Micromonospora sp. A200]